MGNWQAKQAWLFALMAKGEATLAFIGDLMIGRKVEQALQMHEPEWFWGDVLPILQAVDAVVANLECPITNRRRRWPWPKTWYFRASPDVIPILHAGNVRYVNLANNHMLDYRAEGMLDTLEILHDAGILCAGAGENRDAASAGKLMALSGITVGFLSATDMKPSFAAKTDRPGINLRRFSLDADTLPWVREQSRALRAAGADSVVLSVHWGLDMLLRPSSALRTCAHAFLENGIDLIHGQGAHVYQAVEQHAGGAVLYDTGNFLDDYIKFPFRETLWTFVFLVDFAGGRPRRLRLRPVIIEPLSVRLARGSEAEAICALMVSRSRELGMDLVAEPDGLSLKVAESVARSEPAPTTAAAVEP